MPYTYPDSVKDLTPLFKALAASTVNRFIQRAESKINRRLGGKYAIPLQKLPGNYLTGTISVGSGSASVTGVGTLFTQQVVEGDMLYVIDSREPIRIKLIDSDTTLTLEHNAQRTATNSSFWDIPESIATATEYLAASLLIRREFSKQAYNQETEKWSGEYERIAKEEIDGFLMGNYYDTSLVAQTAAKTAARIIQINDTESSERVTNFVKEVNSNSFTNCGTGSSLERDVLITD